MATVADRLELLLADKTVSERQQSERAGLAPTHLGLLRRRLRKDPLAVTLRTLDSIATSFNVSLAWLATGASPVARTLDSCPARSTAAEFAKRDDVWPEAIRSVLADDLGNDATKPAEWWLLRMKMREIEMIEEAVRRQRQHGASPSAPPPAQERVRAKDKTG